MPAATAVPAARPVAAAVPKRSTRRQQSKEKRLSTVLASLQKKGHHDLATTVVANTQYYYINFPLNLNKLETSGLDVEVNYTTELGSFGVLQNRLIAAYLDERTFILRSSDNVDPVAGELGDPELQLNYRGSLLFGNWDVYLELRWIDDMWNEEQELLFGSPTNNDPNPDVNDNIQADSVLYADLGATYRFDNGIELSALIDNVTDEDPPFALFGNGGFSGIYDTIGRFYMVRAVWNLGQ